MSSQESSKVDIQALYSQLYKKRKERQSQGDGEGYILGIQLANEYEDAYEKAEGEYPAKLENVAKLLAPDWAERVQKFVEEKNEFDDPKMLPLDRQVAQHIGLEAYRKIINGG